MLGVRATSVIAVAVFLSAGSSAYAGPCPAQIAQFEQQILRDKIDPSEGPSAAQTGAGRQATDIELTEVVP